MEATAQGKGLIWPNSEVMDERISKIWRPLFYNPLNENVTNEEWNKAPFILAILATKRAKKDVAISQLGSPLFFPIYSETRTLCAYDKSTRALGANLLLQYQGDLENKLATERAEFIDRLNHLDHLVREFNEIQLKKRLKEDPDGLRCAPIDIPLIDLDSARKELQNHLGITIQDLLMIIKQVRILYNRDSMDPYRRDHRDIVRAEDAVKGELERLKQFLPRFLKTAETMYLRLDSAFDRLPQDARGIHLRDRNFMFGGKEERPILIATSSVGGISLVSALILGIYIIAQRYWISNQ